MNRGQFTFLRTPLLVTMAVIVLSGLSSLGRIETDAAVGGETSNGKAGSKHDRVTPERSKYRDEADYDTRLMQTPVLLKGRASSTTASRPGQSLRVYSANEPLSVDSQTQSSIVLPTAAAKWQSENGQDSPGVTGTHEGGSTAVPLSRELMVPAGHSSLIKTPWFVKQVSVADPQVADVQVVAPDQVLVIGRQVGSTDLALWNEAGQVWQTRIYVEIDLVKASRDLNRFLPGAQVKLMQSQDVIVATGFLQQAQQAEALHRFLDASGLKYVDMTSVAGVQQVMIRVRVAEASRQAMRGLGINALHTNDNFFGGSTIGGNPNGINMGVPAEVRTPLGVFATPANANLPFSFNSGTNVSSAVTLFAGFPDADLQLFLEALVDNQYLRVLSEPTLVAVSGEEASFLAGGEIPIPIAQGTTAGGGTAITVDYKEFGVRLRFRPVVLGDGSIRLHVAPEVSDLSDEGAVILQGFRIPTILTRRAETTLEMKSGQTFAMAGLIDRSVVGRAQKVPGLGDLPILGSLFRSVSYERGDTEMVVIATVSLVEPMNASIDELITPGQTHIQPSDWELFMLGKIDGAMPRQSDLAAHWMRQRGLHRLNAPGAWVNYEEPATVVPASRQTPLPSVNNGGGSGIE